MTKIFIRSFRPGAKRDPMKSNMNQSGFLVEDHDEKENCKHGIGWEESNALAGNEAGPASGSTRHTPLVGMEKESKN